MEPRVSLKILLPAQRNSVYWMARLLAIKIALVKLPHPIYYCLPRRLLLLPTHPFDCFDLRRTIYIVRK